MRRQAVGEDEIRIDVREVGPRDIPDVTLGQGAFGFDQKVEVRILIEPLAASSEGANDLADHAVASQLGERALNLRAQEGPPSVTAISEDFF